MKTNISLKRILSFLMALVMVLTLLPAGGLHTHAHAAEAVTMTGGEVLYLKPNSNWLSHNARFAAYFWADGSKAWVDMEPVPGNAGYYQLTVPEGFWMNVMFTTMNPDSSENNWTQVWNDTIELVWDGVNNLCTVTEGEWSAATVEWSQWTPAGTEESSEPEAETITVYFQNNWKWTDVRAYYWGSAQTNPGWRGYEMTYAGNDGSYDIYSAEIPSDIEGLIINGIKPDGSGGTDQTPNITSGWYDGICYYMMWDNGNAVGFEDIEDILASGTACPHPKDSLYGEDNGDGTHKLFCALCEEMIDESAPCTGENPWYYGGNVNGQHTKELDCDCCGAKISQENEPCTGGEATCINPAVCEFCLLNYGESLPPHELTMPYSGTVESQGEWEHIYSWTAENDCEVTFTFEEGLYYSVTRGEDYYSLDNTGEHTLTLSVSAGDEVLVNVWTYETGTFAWTADDGTAVEPDPSEPEADTVTIYFDNTEGWEFVNAYYWSDSNQNMTSWPGAEMTLVEGSIYSIQVPAETENIIFSNSGSGQTADLTIPTDGKNLYTYSSREWSVYGQEPDEPSDPSEPEADTVTIYFDNTEGWESVNAYYWADSNQHMTSWPGAEMTLVEGSIYSIQVPAETENIIFSNSGSGQTADLTIPTDGKNLYTYSSREWSVYGQEPAEITGVSVTVDGETFTEGDVTITPDTKSVIYTVTGINLQNGDENNLLQHLSNACTGIYSTRFVVSDDGTSATLDCSNELQYFTDFRNFEVRYSNEGQSNWIGTGIYLTYNDGASYDKILINMADSDGDGWNGNAILVYGDGKLIGTATIEDGSTATWEAPYDPEAEYELYWIKGAYAEECGIELWIDGEFVMAASGYQYTECLSGERIYPVCKHSCGSDGVCTVCGMDSNHTVSVLMTDSYGDGWDGNGLAAYMDGKFIGTATFDDGKTATWECVYYPEAEYEFYWIQDEYAFECGFEIRIAGETVFTATTDDCEIFTDNYRVYPACEHSWDQGVVIDPTCEDEGYILYTCSLCSLTKKSDYVDSLGHEHAEDDLGTVTEPSCLVKGYTTYTCTTCGESYETDYTDALEHEHAEDDLGVVIDPNCVEEGYTTYTCTACGESFDADYTEPLGHEHAEGDQGTVTDPSCDGAGYTTYICTTCGESYIADSVPKLGHTLGEDGNCTTCGQLYTVYVWVDGEQITGENVTDILGDGTASYDTDTHTLTLSGYNSGCIDIHRPLNIVLEGENTITDEYGIYFGVSGEHTIGGTGSLTVISEDDGIHSEANQAKVIVGGSVTLNLMVGSEGIYIVGNDSALVIKDSATVIAGTESAPLEEECIYVGGDDSASVTITGSASVSCYTNDEEGIYAGGGTSSITVSGNATVYVVGNDEGMDAEFVTITGGTVTAIGGAEDEGIYAHELTVSGGTVYAEGNDQGIEADTITITGGTVSVTGGGMIASVLDTMTPGTITLGEGMAITDPEGATLGELDLTEIEEGVVLAVLNADGTMADSFTISAAEETTITITQQPVSFEGVLGESAVFTVAAAGEDLTYQWYYFDKASSTWLKSYSPGYNTATVSPVFYAYRDGQQYRCVITDVNGNTATSETVTMTLKETEIVIVDQPQAVVNGVINRVYSYTVTALGDNLTYRWQVSTDGGETWNQTWLEGYNTATLTVRLNANRSGNLYRCIVTSAGKDSVTSEAAGLNLQAESVRILEQPANVRALSGETAEFVVEADGMDLTFAWYRYDNGSLTKLEGFDGAVLNLEAGTETAGKYLCKIADGSGKTLSTNVVSLSLRAQIISMPGSITCAAGETAEFTVEALGDNLKYRWYYSTDGGETWTETWLGGYNTDTLSFMVTVARAAKIYKCVITDRYGETVETDPVSVTIG